MKLDNINEQTKEFTITLSREEVLEIHKLLASRNILAKAYYSPQTMFALMASRIALDKNQGRG